MDRMLEEVEVVELRGDPSDTEISSIEFDSRQVGPGALFCCLPGRIGDGHDYAPEAVARGAAALLVERPLPLDVPQVVVTPGTARASMARIAGAMFGHPARALTTVGVTGTNGKTTVTHLLASVLEAAGRPTTVIGTLDGARTTPESAVLQRILAEARAQGRRAVAMEVSSHALTQARVDGIRFDAAVFTNLSHDHLDYHGDMESYFAAKASLFEPARAAVGIVNGDDPWGRRLLAGAGVPRVAYTTADASDVEVRPGSTFFTWRGRRVELALTGSFQVANALAAATTAEVLEIDVDAIVAGLAAVAAVPGRFEVVAAAGPATVVVDYAHSPDALRAVLRSARELAVGRRVVCVFGCGGDRDRAKRPLMGAVAAEEADVVVVTSDNPRGEDPRAIVEEILAGMADRSSVLVEPDRAAAIALALGGADAGDVVVVAGKGHEQEIEVGGRRIPFDDRLVAVQVASEVAANRGRHRP
ncbi:MAG TPA: UDP-N-acetylmuramoyl-L-alanyl-D-glutamate--2,6-diaminopimelate ligase [Acidimicrobiales bacterium]|nr:UDP-N-acetylmuramoyl-L-alanyl-D-glutamate--2,6-diaminopimelate ligase [Acidimicrobiales bacterium]